jgi:hypothetical protein
MKKSKNIQTVPIAISVVTQQTLRDNNVQTVSDLQYVIPSLSAATNAPNEARLSLKDYVTQAVPYYEPPTFGYGGEIFGDPRMYGIRVRYNFGAHAK